MGATNKTNEIWTIEYPKEQYEVNLDEINLKLCTNRGVNTT